MDRSVFRTIGGRSKLLFRTVTKLQSDGYKTILACDPLNNDGRQKR